MMQAERRRRGRGRCIPDASLGVRPPRLRVITTFEAYPRCGVCRDPLDPPGPSGISVIVDVDATFAIPACSRCAHAVLSHG